MTLDEAIKKQRKIAEEKFNNAVYIMNNMKSDFALENAEDYKRSAEEHQQLAEWLTDYKRLLEQEPKTGHWIPLGNYDFWGNESSYKCSECGDRDTYPDNYCPNCGVKMEKVEK